MESVICEPRGLLKDVSPRYVFSCLHSPNGLGFKCLAHRFSDFASNGKLRLTRGRVKLNDGFIVRTRSFLLSGRPNDESVKRGVEGG